MAAGIEEGRIPRRPLLAGMYVLTLTLLVGGLTQEGGLAVSIAVVRVLVMGALTVAFHARRLSHRHAEVGAFVVSVVVVGLSQLFIEQLTVEGAAISLIMASTILMSLGLVVAPDGTHNRLLGLVFVVCAVPPVVIHGPGDPTLYITTLLYLFLMAGLLRSIEATARVALVAGRLARTDPLTELLNRRGVEQALQRAVEDRRASTLLLLDLDHFKALNDTSGHEAGDRALRQVGTILRAFTRGEDVCCRWGGEEFLVLLPDTTVETAREIAERLRVEVHAQTEVSTSIGMVGSRPDETLSSWLRRADEALYAAKARGRNLVVSGDDRAGRGR